MSGILTPENKKNLVKTLKREISVGFTWPITTSYEIKFVKKQEKLKKPKTKTKRESK
jgi:ribonuclease G